MAATVVFNGTNITTAENTTGWSSMGDGGLGAPVQETDIVLQGDYAVSMKASNKDGALYYDNGTGLDFTTTYAGQHIFIWMNCTTLGAIDTVANGGLRIWLGTDTNNYAEWYILGNDTLDRYNGGWIRLVIDPTSTPTATTGTFNTASVQLFGIYINTTGAAKAENLIIDRIDVGWGLRIYGTDTDGWQDVADADMNTKANKYGILQDVQGIFYCYGRLEVGDNIGTNGTTFTDSSRTIKWISQEYWNGTSWSLSISNSFQRLDIVGNATNATTFQDGVKVGSGDAASGRNGSTFIGSDLHVTTVDLYDGSHANNLVQLYGTTLRLMGGISWGNDSNHEFIGAIVDQCGQFDPVGAVLIRNCTFSSTTDNNSDGSALLWNPNIDIKNCSFIANTDVTNDPHAIQHDTTGEFNYYNLQFTGNDFDIDNTSIATVADSYSEANQDATQNLGDGTTTAVGQSFSSLGTGSPAKIANALFYLSKTGNPTGNAIAKLYAHSGTYGTSSVPTGNALAATQNFDVSTLTGALTLTTFEFSDSYDLTADTEYVITLEYNGGDGANYINVGVDASTPTHTGNFSTYTETWAANNGKDAAFYVRVGGVIVITLLDGSNAYTGEEAGAIPGATIFEESYTHTLTNIAAGSELTYVRVSDQEVLYHIESVDAGGETQYTYPYKGQDIIVDILIWNVNYTPESGTFENITLANSNANLRVSQVTDPNYSNP